jgi:hypothetical protein
MPDNVGYTPGSGASIAADDIGGNLFQRVKLVHGADGINAGDVSVSNGLPVEPIGELVESIEALRMAVQALTRSGIGQAMPDTSARLRVVLDAITASLTLATITTVGTVTTVSSMTNQTQMGGFASQDQIPALMRMAADSARRNISVT